MRLKFSWRRLLTHFILLNVGALIGAISVIVFLVPAQVAPSGVTGVATIINHYYPNIPIGLVVILGNIPIQIYAWREFKGDVRVIAYTVYVVIVSSFAIDLLTPYIPPLDTNDRTLLTIFGSILDGVSVALIYMTGATFGGTSTLSRILQIRFGIPQSNSSLYANGLTVILSGLAFGWPSALYALLMLFISGEATDYVMEGPSVIRTAMIITERPNEVSEAIMQNLHRGVTAWGGQGMFTHQPRNVLFVTISRPQVAELRELVLQADSKAFVVIGQGHTAYGEGFIRSRREREVEAGD
jgi:uncharacterized membrane-anchored protein YitT (DUF2179 family)